MFVHYFSVGSRVLLVFPSGSHLGPSQCRCRSSRWPKILPVVPDEFTVWLRLCWQMHHITFSCVQYIYLYRLDVESTNGRIRGWAPPRTYILSVCSFKHPCFFPKKSPFEEEEINHHQQRWTWIGVFGSLRSQPLGLKNWSSIQDVDGRSWFDCTKLGL